MAYCRPPPLTLQPHTGVLFLAPTFDTFWVRSDSIMTWVVSTFLPSSVRSRSVRAKGRMFRGCYLTLGSKMVDDGGSLGIRYALYVGMFVQSGIPFKEHDLGIPRRHRNRQKSSRRYCNHSLADDQREVTYHYIAIFPPGVLQLHPYVSDLFSKKGLLVLPMPELWPREAASRIIFMSSTVIYEMLMRGAECKTKRTRTKQEPKGMDDYRCSNGHGDG